MNKKTILTISKSAIIILILLAVVFALRAPAADLNILPTGDLKAEYEEDVYKRQPIYLVGIFSP